MTKTLSRHPEYVRIERDVREAVDVSKRDETDLNQSCYFPPQAGNHVVCRSGFDSAFAD
jgi:hypothetical protein